MEKECVSDEVSYKVPTEWFCDKEQEDFEKMYGSSLQYLNFEWRLVVNEEGVFAMNNRVLGGDPAFQPWEDEDPARTMKKLKQQIVYLLEEYYNN
jgi:hypothetical protein